MCRQAKIAGKTVEDLMIGRRTLMERRLIEKEKAQARRLSQHPSVASWLCHLTDVASKLASHHCQ